MANIGEDGWEVATSRKGKAQNQAAAGRGKPIVAFPLDRSASIPANGKGRGLPSNTNSNNGRWASGPPASNWDSGNSAWDQQRRSPQKIVNLEASNPPRNSNLNPVWQGNQDPSFVRTAAVVTPPLANGWQWGNRNGSTDPFGKGVGQTAVEDNRKAPLGDNLKSLLLPFEASGEPSRLNRTNEAGDVDSEAETEIDNLDSDEEYLSSDGFDSDSSNVSHETLKNNKWFKDFFGSLAALTIQEVNDPERQWHCPACKGGVGAIDWYRGMQPVLSHAKTITTKRVKLHRKLAEALEEELRRRGAGCVIAEEVFGKWKGLQDTVVDHQIIWPPMVVIQNTKLDQDDNEKWIGMGNKELLEYFKGFKASKARHSYGPRGHRGMSVLIFEESAIGFMEAERLHKQFLREGRGRDDWERQPVLFLPGGKRNLYGYFATKADMEVFNQHSKGKTRLKYDIRSYNEMVVEPMRQMDADNQKLNLLENEVAKQEDYSKTLEETFGRMKSQLRIRHEEVKIIRERATDQHEDHKREMDFLEQSFRQHIEQLNEQIARKELELENLREGFNSSNMHSCSELEASKCQRFQNGDHKEEHMNIDKEIGRRKALMEMSSKDKEEYERERQELIRLHDNRRGEMKSKHLNEELELAKELEKERNDLLEKYMKKGKDAGYVIV